MIIPIIHSKHRPDQTAFICDSLAVKEGAFSPFIMACAWFLSQYQHSPSKRNRAPSPMHTEPTTVQTYVSIEKETMSAIPPTIIMITDTRISAPGAEYARVYRGCM